MFQVVEIQEDLLVTRIDLVELEGDVNFLFDEQIIQDERLFSLEQTVFVIDEDVEGICWLVYSLICNVFINWGNFLAVL